jgi:hypothetical protein
VASTPSQVLRQNLTIARGFKPMTPGKVQALRQRCASFAGNGHLELYKSTKKYDGGVGREQHGYPPLNRSLEHLIKEIERL